MKGRLRPFVFFLFFFLSICPGLLFFFALIDGTRGSLRLVFCCDVLSFFFFGCFSFSGLRDPQGLLYNPFGLGLFSSGLNSLFLGLSLFFLGLIFTVIF